MFVQIALTFSHLVHCSPAADVLWNLEFKYFKRGQERQTNFRDVLHSLTTPPTSENDSGLNDNNIVGCLSLNVCHQQQSVAHCLHPLVSSISSVSSVLIKV